MKKTLSILSIAASMLALGAGLCQSAAAQATFPAKPIKIILSFPPGGSSDMITRLVAPIMAERLGQPVIVENKPGAGGAIAMDAVAKAAPDGYTLGVGAGGSLGVNSVISTARQPYDALKDLTPVGNMVMAAFILVANPEFKPNTIGEIIAESKRRPGTLSIGHGGPGTMMHLASELFKHMSKADAVIVPYKGTAPATMDAMSGQITMAMSDIPSALSYIKTNRLKPIAVTSATRSSQLPNVPTFAEAGLPNYETTGWIAMVAPPNTPPAIVKRINAEMVAALNRPDVREKVLANGYETAASTPEKLNEMMKAEIAKWSTLVKEAHIKID